MAIGVYFHPASMTTAQYDEVMRRLDQAGHAAPKGRTYHSCFGEDGHLMVFDIWDSQADLDAFGPILMPVLAQAGVDPGQPDIMAVHNVVKG